MKTLVRVSIVVLISSLLFCTIAVTGDAYYGNETGPIYMGDKTGFQGINTPGQAVYIIAGIPRVQNQTNGTIQALPPSQEETGSYGLTSSEITEILNAHNAYRNEVGDPPLTWSSAATTYAQNWANTVAGEAAFNPRHSSRVIR